MFYLSRFIGGYGWFECSTKCNWIFITKKQKKINFVHSPYSVFKAILIIIIMYHFLNNSCYYYHKVLPCSWLIKISKIFLSTYGHQWFKTQWWSKLYTLCVDRIFSILNFFSTKYYRIITTIKIGWNFVLHHR